MCLQLLRISVVAFILSWHLCLRSAFPECFLESRLHKHSLVLTPAVPHQYWTRRGRKAGKGSYVLGINVETRKSSVRLQMGIIFLGLGKFEQSWEPLQLREEEEGGPVTPHPYTVTCSLGMDTENPGSENTLI